MTTLRVSEKRRNARVKRHIRVRRKVKGTAERPRLAVFRSAKHIYGQLIDDASHRVLCSASTASKSFSESGYTGNVAAASAVGHTLGKLAKEQGIVSAVFDKGGYRYHGRIKALADGVREAGVVF